MNAAGWRRYEWVLWIALAIGVAAVRWPMVKGLYYRAVHAGAPTTSISWRTDLTAALTESRRTGRPVLADFAAEWCPPCIVMKHDVWPDPDVERAVSNGSIPVAVDVDRNSAVADRFHVDSIPTILLLDSEGHVLRRAGYLPASGVLRFLKGT